MPDHRVDSSHTTQSTPANQINQAPTNSPPRRFFRLPESLFRCAASSLAAVAIEFTLLTLLVSVFHLHYLAGALMATTVYFAINFMLNRRWAFQATTASAGGQLARHVGVVAVGAGMAMGMLRFFVHTIGLPYQVGWLAAGCINFGTWTYPMSRLFTFTAAARPA